MVSFMRQLYRLLNLFSLPFLMKLLISLHFTGSWPSRVFFGLIVLFTLNCFRQNMLAFSYMSSGQFEAYKLVNAHAYAFYDAILGRNSVVFLAGISYLFYSVPMVHYSLFRAVALFRSEGEETAAFLGELYAHRYTFLDRLFSSKLSPEKVMSIYDSLIRRFKSDGYSAKFFTRPDRARFIDIFSLLEKIWLVCFAASWALIGFIYFTTIHMMYVETGSEFTLEYVIVVLTVTSYMFIGLNAVALPVLLLAFLTLLLFTNQAAWVRFCVDFRRIHYRFYHDFRLNSSAVYKKIVYGQKVWIGAFAELSKINRYVVCEIFAVSVGLTLMANTILVVELTIVPFEWRARTVLTIILSVQFFLCGSLTIVLLRLRTRLYSLSPLIRHHVVRQSLFGYFRLRSLWKSHLNMEILCPRRKWTFKLGALGQITSRNILLKCPALYTALILFILPVVERENILK